MFRQRMKLLLLSLSGLSIALLLITCAGKEVAVSSSGPAAPADIPTEAPLIPTGVSATEGNRSVTVTWKPAAGVAHYNIYYATSSSVSKTNGTKVANLSGSPYTVRPLDNKTPYYFVVTAVNAGGESGESPGAMATPLAKAPKPGLVRIPAGTFEMGDNLDSTAYALPVHTVYVDEFYIDKYETIYALWKEVYDWAVDGAQNPRGPDSSDKDTRIRRGGSYRYGSRQLMCSARMFRVPTYTAPYFGFRSVTNRFR